MCRSTPAAGTSILALTPIPMKCKRAIKAAKEPLTKWQHVATQDPEQIWKLWSQWPDANIGGVTDQLLVLDVDKKNGRLRDV